jgi:hypothetical protein
MMSILNILKHRICINLTLKIIEINIVNYTINIIGKTPSLLLPLGFDEGDVADSVEPVDVVKKGAAVVGWVSSQILGEIN